MDNHPAGRHLKARETPLRLSESRHHRSPAVISMPTHHNSARPLTHPRTATGSVLGAGYPSNRFGLRVLGLLQEVVLAAGQHGYREEALAGGPDLDLGAHLRADATVVARSPAAVLDLHTAQGVLPVLPQPVLVQARVEVVPGQHLALLALTGGVPGNIDRFVGKSALRTPHPALITEVLAPAVEPGAVTPCGLDDLADAAVTAGQKSFDDAGFAIVIAEPDGRGKPLVGPDLLAQLLQPRVGLRRAQLRAPLERGVRLGDEPADRDGAPDVTQAGDPSPGLDDPFGEVGDLQHVLVGLGGQ